MKPFLKELIENITPTSSTTTKSRRIRADPGFPVCAGVDGTLFSSIVYEYSKLANERGTNSFRKSVYILRTPLYPPLMNKKKQKFKYLN
jgi:hypothetical protein